MKSARGIFGRPLTLTLDLPKLLPCKAMHPAHMPHSGIAFLPANLYIFLLAWGTNPVVWNALCRKRRICVTW
jgi:hypothetical protein